MAAGAAPPDRPPESPSGLVVAPADALPSAGAPFALLRAGLDADDGACARPMQSKRTSNSSCVEESICLHLNEKGSRSSTLAPSVSMRRSAHTERADQPRSYLFPPMVAAGRGGLAAVVSANSRWSSAALQTSWPIGGLGCVEHAANSLYELDACAHSSSSDVRARSGSHHLAGSLKGEEEQGGSISSNKRRSSSRGTHADAIVYRGGHKKNEGRARVTWALRPRRTEGGRATAAAPTKR